MLQVRGRAQGIDLVIRELLGEQLPEPAAESLARQAAFRAFPLGASKFQRVGSRASEALDLEENVARRLLRDTQNAAHQGAFRRPQMDDRRAALAAHLEAESGKRQPLSVLMDFYRAGNRAARPTPVGVPRCLPFGNSIDG